MIIGHCQWRDFAFGILCSAVNAFLMLPDAPYLSPMELEGLHTTIEAQD